jgi:hypothetical protein
VSDDESGGVFAELEELTFTPETLDEFTRTSHDPSDYTASVRSFSCRGGSRARSWGGLTWCAGHGRFGYSEMLYPATPRTDRQLCALTGRHAAVVMFGLSCLGRVTRR